MVELKTAKFSIDEYHQIVATGILRDRHVELLNGELIEMPSEGPSHANGSSDTGDYLRTLLAGRAKVREGHPITLPVNNSEPEPDLAIVRLKGQLYSQRHPLPDDIYFLIEFSDSSLEKDLDPKAQIYATAGIAEYWVVDLRSRVLVVHRVPRGDRYQSIQRLTGGAIAPLAFPDIEVSVEQILPHC